MRIGTWRQSSKENVKVAQDAVTAAQRDCGRETARRQAEVGALAPLDVVSAQSAMAGAERDLVVVSQNEL